MSDNGVDKGIPIPKPAAGGVNWNKYNLGVLKEEGDSRLVETDGSTKARNRVFSAAHHYGRKHGRKFTCRTVDGGVRVWRIE